MSKSTWGTATGMVGLLMTVAACSAEGPYSDDMEGPSAAASQAIMADSGTIDPPERSGPISPAPSNLRLASASSMTIKLDFACGRNATSHEVYRRVNGGAWAATPFWQAPCTDSLGIAWDRAVQPETSYCYKVKAYNLTNTAYSNVFCTVSPKDTVAPVAPVVDSVTDVTRTTLTVNYTDKANNETGFTVWRRSEASPQWRAVYTKRRGTSEDRTVGQHFTFQDGGLLTGTRYEYKVTAFNNYLTSLDSNVRAATTLPDRPVAPTNLRITGMTAESVSLAWDDNNEQESNYIVKWKAQDSSVQGSRSLAANTTHCSVGPLGSGRFCFTVRASNAEGVADSSQVCATLAGVQSETTTILLEGSTPYSGVRPYWAHYLASRTVTEVQVVPNQILGTLVVRFIKPGFTTDECTKSDGKWVDVAQGQSVPLSALFGNATPLGPIDMLACVFAPAGTQVDALFLNVTSIP